MSNRQKGKKRGQKKAERQSPDNNLWLGRAILAGHCNVLSANLHFGKCSRQETQTLNGINLS